MKYMGRAVAAGFLYTDQYQLTMTRLYWRMGFHETTVQFDHSACHVSLSDKLRRIRQDLVRRFTETDDPFQSWRSMHNSGSTRN